MRDVLSAEHRSYFVRLMRRQMNSAVHRRMNILLLLDDGWSAEAIAQALSIDEATIRDHLALDSAKGRSGVDFLAYERRAPALNPEQEGALMQEGD